MKNITMIAAVGKNLELGKDNQLLWRLPEDLQFFKQQTLGKKIVMGKKTLDSLPGLLPKRTHIVLTHQDIEPSERLLVFHDINELKEYLQQLREEVMIIGGAQIYQQFIEDADKLVLTEIDGERPDADAYFPLFDKNAWEQEVLCEHQHEDIKYKHLVYTRKK